MISFNGVTKQYGSQVLYKNAGFQLNPGEKVGLVGSNGSGKTTVFRIITGEDGIDGGSVSVPEKIVVGYFSQSVGDMHGRSVLDEVLTGAGRISTLAALISDYEKQLQATTDHPLSENEMTVLLERFGEAQLEFEQRGGYDLEPRAKAILTGLGIGPEDFQRPVESFSGGWKMRIALAKILLLNPDVLLMDEPTNHLDLESIIWLEEWLRQFKGALMMTSHDREFMNRLVTRIIEISQQTITSYTGNYDFYEKEKIIRLDQLKASHRKQQEMLAKEEEFIARFAARASHAAQVQSRVKKLEKIERIEIPPEADVIRFEFPPAPRTGNEVVKMEGVAKVWPISEGKQKSVFSGVTALIKRLEKVAVVGINGAGKSTLLKIIAGQTEATQGQVTIGANVKVGYFSQHSLDVLDPENTIYDEVHNRIPSANISYVRSLLGAFLFSGDEVYKKISILSGGEKSRVLLATILASPVNLLILDEPTNHLDISSREILLDALKKFDGTILIVSHDRHFLKALATRVVEIGHGHVQSFGGTYDYYLSKVAAQH